MTYIKITLTKAMQTHSKSPTQSLLTIMSAQLSHGNSQPTAEAPYHRGMESPARLPTISQ